MENKAHSILKNLININNNNDNNNNKYLKNIKI